MNFFIYILTKFFDIILLPFTKLSSPVYGLIFISLLSGIFFLKIFGLVSNQKGIKKVKDKIRAHILEIVLFKDSLSLSLKAILKLLSANFLYMKFAVIPLFFMIIIFSFFYGQLQLRYGNSPLKLGDETIFKLTVNNNANLDDYSIQVTEGLKQTTPPLRIRKKQEIYWRIKALAKGEHSIIIKNKNKDTVSFPVYTGNVTAHKIPDSNSDNTILKMLYPGLKPLDTSSGIKLIELNYPVKKYKFLFFNLSWLIYFFIISVLSGLVFKKFIKVEI